MLVVLLWIMYEMKYENQLYTFIKRILNDF